MRSILLTTMLLACACDARADWTYSLDPPQTHAGRNVNVRVDDSPTGCFPSQNPQVVRQNSTVTITFSIDDFLPPNTPPGTCPPERVTPRFFPLGDFAPGNYEVRVINCTNAPPPDQCVLQATLPLVVSAPSGVFTVPATRWPGVLLLVIAIAIGYIARRPK